MPARAKPQRRARRARPKPVASIATEALKPYFPQDLLAGDSPDAAAGADWLELTAFLAPDSRVFISEITSVLEVGQDEYENVDDVLQHRGLAANATVSEIQLRVSQLGDAYPFVLNDRGAVLSFREPQNWGQTLYVLSLILSHLPSEQSPILSQASLLPTDAEVVLLRRWFQYCTTASVAAEIGGDAWAFGWPRPDHSEFLKKLKDIWRILKDGDVRDTPLPGSAKSVKDDEIDIIAARTPCDGLQGFPIILGQVASGQNWKSKPLRGHADHTFYPEWFSNIPASQTLVYHIIPFVIEPDIMRLQTRRLGHLMHRVRLAIRALEVDTAIRSGSTFRIEGLGAFEDAKAWSAAYRARGGIPPVPKPARKRAGGQHGGR